MNIIVNVRTIPEIAQAYRNRLNKKDSFNRWLNNSRVMVDFTNAVFVPNAN